MNQQVPDELISAYFDGEVTADERVWIEQQLDSSNDLRQLLDDTAKLSALLHSFPRLAAPAQLASQIQMQISDAVATPSRSIPVIRKSLRREWTAFAGGMVATVASLMLWITVRSSVPSSNMTQLARSESLAKSSNSLGKGLQKKVIGRSDQTDHVEFEKADEILAYQTSVDRNVKLSDDVQLHGVLLPGKGESAITSMALAPKSAVGEQSEIDLQRKGELLAGNEMRLPQEKEGFLYSLKNGTVIEQQIRDPNNVVMVVELTVVDVEKGIEGLHLLLQKRNLQRLDEIADNESAKKSSAKDLVASRGLQKNADGNGLGVLYVRASGSELAEMLTESIKDQPELYREFVPQLPIEVAWDDAATNSSESSTNPTSAADNPVVESKKHEESINHRLVTADANLAIQNYAISNGLILDDTKMAQKQVAHIKQNLLSSIGKMGTNPVASIGGADDKMDLRKEGNVSTTNVPRTDLDKPAMVVDKAAQASIRDAQGYAEFRFFPGSRQPSSEPQQEKLKTSRLTENPAANSVGVDHFGGKSDLPSQKQFVQQQRESGVMRMLIVLKPERAATNP